MADLSDKWSIKIVGSYSTKSTLIEQFEHVVAEIKNAGYSPMAGGNNSFWYIIKGPAEPPLSNAELAKLRELIR